MPEPVMLDSPGSTDSASNLTGTAKYFAGDAPNDRQKRLGEACRTRRMPKQPFHCLFSISHNDACESGCDCRCLSELHYYNSLKGVFNQIPGELHIEKEPLLCNDTSRKSTTPATTHRVGVQLSFRTIDRDVKALTPGWYRIRIKHPITHSPESVVPSTLYKRPLAAARCLEPILQFCGTGESKKDSMAKKTSGAF